eukprot:CAMPEP_0183305978 /NCGR_PEP_ID=MMETSP0160_2-20130417/10544_1 /TAXON_ID=2839 ORGANISM="Odontella Sinensis, Strain Grunow 1884" /NCGR_SAMPLE_ID=MMETSP0160_2 /ASSEMBLY_ACC=CAM_ASM_000250 /LENGTH=172 /DNA_ID=CAMNT_0025469271 /DNA_START=375 /DNA_END=893 /DNA_ORIENTATION=+
MGALKHSVWVCVIMRERWTWDLAIGVAVVNNWFDWTHAQCLLHRRGIPSDTVGEQVITMLGAVMVVVGLTLELRSEWQRATFKNDPRNDGKLFTGGCFRNAQHINYLGYIIWRTGLGCISGPPFTLMYGVYHAIDFYCRAIPLLQNYMLQKYGTQWTRYKETTRSVLIPGIL